MGNFDNRFSSDELEDIVNKYGVIRSDEDFRDERSKQIMRNYGHIIVFNEIPDRSNRPMIKFLSIAQQYPQENAQFMEREYHRIIKSEVDGFINENVNNWRVSKDISPTDFGYILDLAVDNLSSAIMNYELSKSGVVVFLDGVDVSSKISQISEDTLFNCTGVREHYRTFNTPDRNGSELFGVFVEANGKYCSKIYSSFVEMALEDEE